MPENRAKLGEHGWDTEPGRCRMVMSLVSLINLFLHWTSHSTLACDLLGWALFHLEQRDS